MRALSPKRTNFLMLTPSLPLRRRARTTVPHILTATILLLGLESSPAAATYTWRGGSGNLWSTAANWVQNVAPPSDLLNTDLVFGGGTTASFPSISGSYSIHSLLFGSDATVGFNFDGGPLTLGAGGFTQNSAFSENFSTAEVLLGADQTWQLASGSGMLTFAAGLNTTGGGVNRALTIDAATSTGNGNVVGGVITGGGSLVKTGAGVLTLTGNSDFTGAITIKAGTLQVGQGGAAGTLGAGSITDSGTLSLNRSDDVTVANTISGSGGLVKLGAGMLTLSGTNTFFGATTLGTGTLLLGSALALQNSTVTITAGAGAGALGFTGTGTAFTLGGLAGTGPLVLTKSGAGVNLTVGRNNGSTSYAGALSGLGQLLKIGSGTFTITGTNSYTGGTTFGAGTLNVGSAGALGTSGTLTFSGGTLQFSAANTQDYSARFATTANQTFSLDTNGQNVVLATALVSNGGILSKSGLGTLTLLAANTYSNYTMISAGTLQVGNGGTAGSLTGTVISDNGLLTINRGDDYTLSLGINGTGSLTHAGSGTLTLTGDSTYSGTTSISLGKLQIGAGGTTGSLGSGEVFDTGGLIFNRDGSLEVAAKISGSGSVSNTGPGTVTLTGSNTYSGTTTLAAGTLVAGRPEALGTGSISSQGGTLAYTTGNSTDYSARLLQEAGQAFRIDTGGQAVTFATALTSAGGTLAKLGGGTLSLTATNTYSGTTTVLGGTLQVGDGSTHGTLGGGSVTDNAVLSFNRSDNLTVSTAIGGSGQVIQAGTGTLTLSGNNTYTGGTILQSGVLALGSAGALGSSGTVKFSGGGLQFSAANTVDYSSRFVVSGEPQNIRLDTNGQAVSLNSSFQILTPGHNLPSSLIKDGAGTLTLTKTLLLYGTVQVNSGTLLLTGSLGSPAAYTGSDGPQVTISVAPGAVFQTSGGNLTASSVIVASTATQAGNFVQSSGSAKLGYLQLMDRAQATISGGIVNGSPGVDVGTDTATSGATLAISGSAIITAGETFINGPASAITQSGTSRLAATSLSFSADSGSPTYNLNGGTLNLGLLIPDFGVFNFNGGLLQLSADVTSHTEYVGLLSVQSGGARIVVSDSTVILSVGLSHAAALGNTIDGGLTKSGAGVLALYEDSTYTGDTTVQGGVLDVEANLGNGGVTISANADLVNNVNIAPRAGKTVEVNGGRLFNSGTVTGTINVNSGIVQTQGSLNGTVNVNSGATIAGNGNGGALHIFAGGTLAPGLYDDSVFMVGAGSAASLRLAGGAVYQFQLSRASGSPGTDADFLTVEGALSFEAGNGQPVLIRLESVAYADAQDVTHAGADDFDSGHRYVFPLLTAGGGIAGFSPALFTVDTSRFTPSLNGGSFSVAANGNNLNLVFTPVPEPGTAGLLSAAGVSLLRRRRRRQP